MHKNRPSIYAKDLSRVRQHQDLGLFSAGLGLWQDIRGHAESQLGLVGLCTCGQMMCVPGAPVHTVEVVLPMCLVHAC